MDINGIIRVYNAEEDSCFFTTEKMIENNILIEDIGSLLDENKIRRDLNLFYVDDSDTKMFTLSLDFNITPLMTFTLVKEIVSLFEALSLDDFFRAMEELSEGTLFTSHLNMKEEQEEFRRDIIGRFEIYKNTIEEDKIKKYKNSDV